MTTPNAESKPLLLQQADGSKKYGEFYLSETSPDFTFWILCLSALCIVIAIAYLIKYYLIRHYRHNLYRKQALKQIKRIYQDYLDHKTNLRVYLQKSQGLLKQTALTAYANQKTGDVSVASLTGSAWYDFLLKRLGQKRRKQALLGQIQIEDFSLYYKPEPVLTNAQPNQEQDAHAASFYQFAVLWIRYHQNKF